MLTVNTGGFLFCSECSANVIQGHREENMGKGDARRKSIWGALKR